ncbi:MAG: iron-containing alcohol dehydrogenase, partial [Atopobiaceae bacterium]|nr:iron-containing alcohol dehydrogenase [Atopobiaceae bacterium]
MLDFTYSNQTKHVFGEGVIARVGEEAAALTESRVAMVVRSASAWQQPLFEQVEASLEEVGFTMLELSGVKPNPMLSKVREGVAIAKEHGVGILIGIGGGSPIDTAKGIAAGACYEGDVWDLYIGTDVECNLPVIAIPTIAASGSEMSIFSVITNDETLEKNGCGAMTLRPAVALCDPATTCTLPPFQTAAGAADIMAHAMDTYFGDTQQADFQHMMLEAIMRTVVKYAPEALIHPNDMNARSQLMLAGSYAMGQQLGVGHATNLAPHEIGEYLGGIYDVTHGAVLAV